MSEKEGDEDNATAALNNVFRNGPCVPLLLFEDFSLMPSEQEIQVSNHQGIEAPLS